MAPGDETARSLSRRPGSRGRRRSPSSTARWPRSRPPIRARTRHACTWTMRSRPTASAYARFCSVTSPPPPDGTTRPSSTGMVETQNPASSRWSRIASSRASRWWRHRHRAHAAARLSRAISVARSARRGVPVDARRGGPDAAYALVRDELRRNRRSSVSTACSRRSSSPPRRAAPRPRAGAQPRAGQTRRLSATSARTAEFRAPVLLAVPGDASPGRPTHRGGRRSSILRRERRFVRSLEQVPVKITMIGTGMSASSRAPASPRSATTCCASTSTRGRSRPGGADPQAGLPALVERNAAAGRRVHDRSRGERGARARAVHRRQHRRTRTGRPISSTSSPRRARSGAT